MRMDAEPILDEELAEFLQSGVAMHASAVSGRTPQVTRAAGCRVSRDRRAVTIFVAEAHGEALLASVRENGAVAVVFTRPKTHRTVQLKGRDARVAAASAEDHEVARRQVAIFDAELAEMRFPREFGRTLCGGEGARLAAITFTPACGFVQTPGPSAGSALKRP
jgi:hypothetical protein